MTNWGLKNQRCLAVYICAVLFLATAAFPQSSSTTDHPGTPDSPGTVKSQPSEKEAADLTRQVTTGTSNDRLFYALPNFMTVETTNVPPLTAGQKFKVVTRGSFDYIQLPWYGFLAGMSQAQNSEPGYGQGAAGYGKRLAAYFADGTIENYMTGAVLPIVLHEDPRFFQSGKGGFWHRTGYAMSRIFVTRTDAGGSRFNFSEVVGSAMSAGISTYSYHPQQDRTIGNTMSVWGSQIGYDTMTTVVKEFWPDMRRKLQKKKSGD